MSGSTSAETPRIVGLVGSPRSGGSTAAAVGAVLDGAAGAGAAIELRELAEADLGELATELEGADGFVLGTPVYRATYSGLLKELLDRVPRGYAAEEAGPLRAKPVAVVATGASAHHFLAGSALVTMLSGFFASYVVPPGLYLEPADFDEGKQLRRSPRCHADWLGAALARLAATIGADPLLSEARAEI